MVSIFKYFQVYFLQRLSIISSALVNSNINHQLANYILEFQQNMFSRTFRAQRRIYEIILVPIFFFFSFFFILNKTTSCKNKMSFPSESGMMSKELQNSDLIYVNLMTDVFKIIVKYRRKIIAKYRHLSPSGNRV